MPIVAVSTFGLGSVGGDAVEDVDEHEEESDEEGHAPRDHVRRDHEAYPRHHHEQTCKEAKSSQNLKFNFLLEMQLLQHFGAR